MNLYCFEWTEYQFESTTHHQLLHTLATSEETAKAAMQYRMIQIAMAVERIQPLIDSLKVAENACEVFYAEWMHITRAPEFRRAKMPKNGCKDVQAWTAYQDARATDAAAYIKAETEFNARPDVTEAFVKRDSAETALNDAFERLGECFGNKVGGIIKAILKNTGYYDETSPVEIMQSIRNGADFEIVQLDVILGD